MVNDAEHKEEKYELVMGKMKFLTESIPASSAVFWNRFRIIGPGSVSGIDSGNGIDS